MSVSVFYDGECPFCDAYVRLLRLRESAGEVVLVDLRDDANVRAGFEAQGFNLDEGMVVDLDGQLLGGADAVNALALMSTRSGLFNRLNWAFLGSEKLARILYPLLRAGRWIVLFLMGRQGLSAHDEGMAARQTIFAQFFALFSIFHFFNYALEYSRFPPGLDQAFLLGSALILLFRPQSARFLFLLMLTSTISAVVQAPAHSNHTMVRHFVLLGYWLSFIWAWAGGSSWQVIFARFAPAGQGALLVMYVFGVFHKINSDFLNPATSCAVALWEQMPPPLSWINGPLIEHAAIYGTFIVEGAFFVMLLARPTRHFAIVGGILFHVLLALSGYAMYITFTTLSIALHVLFINADAAKRIVASREMQIVRSRIVHPLYLMAAFVLVTAMALTGLMGEYSIVTLLMLPIIVPFCWLVIRYGGSDTPLGPREGRGRGLAIGALTTFLFFANCMMPYLGLKSAQAIGMFSNLRLEAGVSNHLLMPVPGPFDYLERVAVIDDPGDDPWLRGYHDQGLAIVYYDLLARMADNPDARISFTLDGVPHVDVSASDFADDIATVLHPAWVRKWFHFQPVVLTRPEPCNV